jgi:hypothetical protein
MIFFHPIRTSLEIERTNPLHVSNFYNLEGMWWSKRKRRQAMVLSIAVAWYHATSKLRKAPGLLEEEMLLTALTSQVGDAKKILTHFFTIKRTGFNFNNGTKSATLVSPKKISDELISAIEQLLNTSKFCPGPEPDEKDYVTSEVVVRKDRWLYVKERLHSEGKEELISAVNWLYEAERVTFYYKAAGKLQARDVSVWPIRSLEMWPGWLRKELFGTVVDIENSYCQFLVSHLYRKYMGNMKLLELKYPELLKADRQKKEFREDICKNVLHLPISSENLKHVKTLIMALSNGSRASPGLMLDGSSRSEAVRVVMQANPTLTAEQLISAGNRLQTITRQFRAAKKDICLNVLKIKPTSENLKKVFQMYFSWEREQRYNIWEMTNFSGVNAHDGLDGVIISDENTFANDVFEKHGLRIKVESYCE